MSGLYLLSVSVKSIYCQNLLGDVYHRKMEFSYCLALWVKFSADDKLVIFFLFLPENRI